MPFDEPVLQAKTMVRSSLAATVGELLFTILLVLPVQVKYFTCKPLSPEGLDHLVIKL